MYWISENIFSALKESNIIIQRLDDSEKEKVWDRINLRYIDSKKKGIFLWEKLKDYVMMSDELAWSYLKNFIGKNECIIFFDPRDDKDMFWVSSGSDLDYIISETYEFEFYITDENCSYLLAFSHHDILYGCGVAKKWVKELKGNMY